MIFLKKIKSREQLSANLFAESQLSTNLFAESQLSANH